MAVQPNHVYVIPPNNDMGILDGVLQLLPRPAAQGPHMPIDYFLRSLAADLGSRAIGVILSGTGSDGTLGVKAIKGEGGITFAQDEESAKYPGMPQSAIASGAVDFILSAGGIAQELARIGQHPYVNHARAPENVESRIGREDELRSVFVQLRNLSGVNFGLYKPSTVKRRIRRRMVVHKIEKLKDYVTFLQGMDCLESVRHQNLVAKPLYLDRGVGGLAITAQNVLSFIVHPCLSGLPMTIAADRGQASRRHRCHILRLAGDTGDFDKRTQFVLDSFAVRNVTDDRERQNAFGGFQWTQQDVCGKFSSILPPREKRQSSAHGAHARFRRITLAVNIESMRRRVRQLGGQFDSMPARPGTTLKVVLPLSTEKHETDSRASGR
jgi:hypothetical protein